MKKSALAFALIACVAIMCSCTGGKDLKNTDAGENDYKLGDAVIPAEIQKIDVEWASGSVSIVYHDKDSVIIAEKNDSKTEENQRMAYALKGSTLYVRYCKGKALFNGGKELTVALPENYKGREIDINTSSADVNGPTVEFDKVSIETHSGNILLGLSNASEIELETHSGNISLQQSGFAKSLEAQSHSGDVTIASENAKKTDIETHSGLVSLLLNQKHGFTLTADTKMGEYDCDFETKSANNVHTYKDGENKISITTKTGDISVAKMK